MEQIKVKEKEMTAQESLNMINEMLNNSRRSILHNSGKYFILWGILLSVFSLIIYALWHYTGSPDWNLMWILMLLGYPIAHQLDKKDIDIPQNLISKQIGKVWLAYGIFAFALSAISFVIAPHSLSLILVVILGFTECISGILLKNWPIIIGGFILGVGGAIGATMLKSEAQLLLFTLGGILLIVTGIIIKQNYK